MAASLCSCCPLSVLGAPCPAGIHRRRHDREATFNIMSICTPSILRCTFVQSSIRPFVRSSRGTLYRSVAPNGSYDPDSKVWGLWKAAKVSAVLCCQPRAETVKKSGEDLLAAFEAKGYKTMHLPLKNMKASLAGETEGARDRMCHGRRNSRSLTRQGGRRGWRLRQWVDRTKCETCRDACRPRFDCNRVVCVCVLRCLG